MASLKPLRVLVVGCGHMGTSHARAYHEMSEFEICGLVSRQAKSRDLLNTNLQSSYPTFSDIAEALRQTRPDAVCIATYPKTHAPYAKLAFAQGCHVFLEKPMALDTESASELVESARESGQKLVIGYILQHHPAWIRFVEEARKLGKPLVMRMNLNQQSSGEAWRTHQEILRSMSPIVDCGVHYVEVMCRMTQAKPLRVHAIGARLDENLVPGMYNYGQLQIEFEDGSVGWYEAGWGPMISETAFFVKDVMGPRGSVSIIDTGKGPARSDDVQAHTRVPGLLLHQGVLDEAGLLAEKDTLISLEEELDHDGLCRSEQQFFLNAIHNDLDLTAHLAAAYHSLQIVLAADESIRKGGVIRIRRQGKAA